MRFIALDTETTGMNKKRNGDQVCAGHRVIEIGCVEIIGKKVTGRQFHTFCNPGRGIDPGAVRVHGLTDEIVKTAPLFHDVAKGFVDFIGGSTLIIHNARFDIAFLDQEFAALPKELQPVGLFTFIDTLELAREAFPFNRNDLDSLCSRGGIGGRVGAHGALIDAKLLADVFLAFFC